MPDPNSSRPLAGLSEIAQNYHLILCDVWGVVHDGERATPSACAALARFREQGGIVILITNAPRPSRAITPKLDAFGVPRGAYDGVVSSGDIALDLMLARPREKIFHLGPPRDDDLFEAFRGLSGQCDPRASLEQADYCVCTGLDDDEDAPSAYHPRLERMARRGLTMICANPDLAVHVGEKLYPCAGALAADYAMLGGEVILVGKPHAQIYAKALDFYETLLDVSTESGRGSASPLDRRRVLAIGDGMGTDMRGAHAQNLDGLFISGGVHRDLLHKEGWSVSAYRDLCADMAAAPIAHAPVLTW